MLSIIIPTKNRSHLLKLAIQSVIGQGFEDYELIICDNDDEDYSIKKNENHSNYRSHKKIKYIRTGGLDMCANWNIGLDNASGKFITILEDKMCFYPGALEKISNVIENSDEQVIVWPTDDISNEHGNEILLCNQLKENQQIVSSDIISSITEDPFGVWTKIPRGLSCFISRDLMTELNSIEGNKFFENFCPDFLTGLKILNKVKKYNYMGESFTFLTSYKDSNGKLFRDDSNEKWNYYGKNVENKIQKMNFYIDKFPGNINYIINDYLRYQSKFRAFPKILKSKYYAMLIRESIIPLIIIGDYKKTFSLLKLLLKHRNNYIVNFGCICSAIINIFLKKYTSTKNKDTYKKIKLPLPSIDYFVKFLGNEINLTGSRVKYVLERNN
jgi:glycosyltransferase involved in cell wall biosynthesis